MSAGDPMPISVTKTIQQATRSTPDLLEFVVRIVSAHVSNNAVTGEALPDLIRSVHAALRDADSDSDGTSAPQRGEPAVPIEKSVFPDYLVCLEDGRKMTMLKRHLSAAFGMTPEQYRKRWGLPANYPMVAPEYAARRSMHAKQLGLGRQSARVEKRCSADPAIEGAGAREGRHSRLAGVE